MTVYRRDPRAHSRRISDETVLLHLDTEEYHALNLAGSVLWERLESDATAEDLTATLIERFGIEEGQASREVEVFLTEVMQRRLITGT